MNSRSEWSAEGQEVEPVLAQIRTFAEKLSAKCGLACPRIACHKSDGGYGKAALNHIIQTWNSCGHPVYKIQIFTSSLAQLC